MVTIALLDETGTISRCRVQFHGSTTMVPPTARSASMAFIMLRICMLLAATSLALGADTQTQHDRSTTSSAKVRSSFVRQVFLCESDLSDSSLNRFSLSLLFVISIYWSRRQLSTIVVDYSQKSRQVFRLPLHRVCRLKSHSL
jgi:hypothetical protein